MRSIECDQDGNPRIYYAIGVDPAEPDKVVPVIHEIRPGGMIVIKAVPDKRITVAPDPLPPPSLEQIEAERMNRAVEAAAREREAITAERGGVEGDAVQTEEEGEDEEAAAERTAREAAARRAESGGTKTRSRATRSR